MTKRNRATEAGRFDQWIVFEKKTDSRSKRSAPTETWTEVYGTWGSYQTRRGSEWPPLGGRELIAEKRFAQNISLFIIHYDPADPPQPDTHRIVYQGKRWNIHDVRQEPDGQPVELHIDASVLI